MTTILRFVGPVIFDPAIAEIGWNRRANPIAFADVLRVRYEIERRTAIELMLVLLPPSQRLEPAAVEISPIFPPRT